MLKAGIEAPIVPVKIQSLCLPINMYNENILPAIVGNVEKC